MKQDIAEKWADALESGDYPKTTNCLYDPDEGFCCLGVLCKVLGKDFDYDTSKPSLWGIRNPLGTLEFTVLPIEITREVGMRSQSGLFHKNHVVELTALNDGDAIRGIKPHTFKEIAKVIRENWELL